MILMSVRDHHAADLVAVLLEIGVIRNDQIDAQHIAVGERHTAVDEDDIVLTLEHSQVLADLVESAEERHAYGRLRRRFLFDRTRFLALCVGSYPCFIRTFQCVHFYIFLRITGHFCFALALHLRFLFRFAQINTSLISNCYVDPFLLPFRNR